MANLKAELNQFYGIGSQTLKMFLGACKPCDKKNATKVMVSKFVLDENLFAVSNLKN